MKKDMLNELSGLDPETVNNIAENAPELGKDAQERILKKCIAKDMSCDEMTVSGTERYSRPRFRSFAAAAAVMVLIGGIGGAFALGKHMKKNAPVESKAGLLTTTEGTSDGKDRNNTETQPTAEAAPTEGTTAGEAGNLPETTYIEKPTQTDPLWLDPAYAEIDVAQPTTEYKVPDNVDDEQYEAWMKEIPEEYWDVVRNLKPGEVIHLPCLPLRTTPDTNTIETTTATTTKTTTVTTIQQEKTTTQPKTTTEQPDNNEPDVYLTVLKPIQGYWYSNRTSQAQYYFGPCGEGLYYDSNTCWGYSFSYVYDQNAGTIEYSAYNADGTLSDTICDKGRVYFTGNNKMVVFWEKGLDGVQGVPEYFTPNTSGAMAE